MSDSANTVREIEELWQGYLTAVINADLEHYGSYLGKDYVGHMGEGRIERSRAERLAIIGERFEASKAAGPVGDPDALLEHDTEITVLTENLVLVQFSCLLAAANVRYGISSIIKRTADGWKVIQDHDSTMVEG